MPLKAPAVYPGDQRSFDQWTRQVPVIPDAASVGTVELKDGQVTYAKLQAVGPVSVIGNLHSTAQAPGEITAGADNRLLIRRSNLLTFDILADGDIPASIARDSEVAAGDAAVTAGYIAADAALVAAKFITNTYTGAFTGTVTDPAPIIRYSVSGSIVVLQIPSASATSNANSFTITGAPAAIRPQRNQIMLIRLTDNGAPSFGIATMDSSGVITFGVGATGAAFTTSGTKGVSGILTYSLD